MPPSATDIIDAIDSGFNSIIAEAFLCGLYTLLFAYALRTLLRKENKKLYATVLTLLWVLVMLSFAFDWQYHRAAFVIDNDSPIDIAIGIVHGGGVESLYVLDNILSVSCNWLADALLIWRCYILWEDRRWALLPLPVLLTAAFVLGSLSVVPQFANPGRDGFIFLVAFYAVSIAITFMGTSLIILRILLVTQNSPLTTDTRGYHKVQAILIESGILYTIAMFITGVTLGLQVTAHAATSALGELAVYTEAILIPLSGIAPTLIAVRVRGEALPQADAGASYLTFRRTVQQNGTFDTGDVVSGPGESPTDSSIGRDGYGTDGHCPEGIA